MTAKKDPAVSEEMFLDIIAAAKTFSVAVERVPKKHAAAVLRRLEQLTYESIEGAEDDEFQSAFFVEQLAVVDVARQHLATEYDLPFHERDELIHRWAVARVAAQNDVVIDPTFGTNKGPGRRKAARGDAR